MPVRRAVTPPIGSWHEFLVDETDGDPTVQVIGMVAIARDAFSYMVLELFEP